jgi:hypothetical protein
MSGQIQLLKQPALLLPKIALVGITTVSRAKKALLRVEPPCHSPAPAGAESLTPGEGRGSGQLEELAIDEQAASVQVNNSGVSTLPTLEREGPGGGSKSKQ